MEPIRKELPTIILDNKAVLPGEIIQLTVSSAEDMAAAALAMRGERKVFLVMKKDPLVYDEIGTDALNRWGTVAQLRELSKHPQKKSVKLVVQGLYRAMWTRIARKDDYQEAEVEVQDQITSALTPIEEEAYAAALISALDQYARVTGKLSKTVVDALGEMKFLQNVVAEIAAHLEMPAQEKQEFLAADDLEERYRLLLEYTTLETERITIRQQVIKSVHEKVEKNQREYILREHLKEIREQLGEDTVSSDARQYEQQLLELQAPEEIKEKIQKEITRFRSLGQNTPESSIARGYLETLLALPWEKQTEDDEDLKKARKTLDDDHYGLEEVKERVLEFLAVRRLVKDGVTPILCLAGPPGTGKTSIARSIAASMGKKYVRISLGGVRDEAEIRGHRRTYVGAMPGRLIAALRQAGVNNPLILLDEIDKLSSSYNGDPSAALLEVLDSEQNSAFIDHYVDMPTDLSHVMFVATANDLGTVPRPLLDRMEVIEVSSYTANEKFHIAKDHLIPKQMKKHGIERNQMKISDKAIEEIIAGYTREAGVRSLERTIAKICRKAAKKIWEDPDGVVKIKVSNIKDYLGNRKVEPFVRNKEDQVGIVRGLAWTSVGGVTLEVEVNTLPGKGEMRVTGQLGDVMKESSAAAVSYVRSIASDYDIPDDYFQTHDVHIHIPEGAVPKDGPSAGITMATAILSAASGRAVRADVAMTGEVTLRGRVLAIGGLKEKLLAANKALMRTVIVPSANKKDVQELSDEIIGSMQIVYADTMDDVLKAALVGK